MSWHTAHLSRFDPALHRPGTRAAAGLCARCRRDAEASVVTCAPSGTRSYGLCGAHLGDFMLRGLPATISDEPSAGGDGTPALSAGGPSDNADVVICPGYSEHPVTLGWAPEIDVRFGRCAACGRPVPLDEDGLTTVHSW